MWRDLRERRPWCLAAAAFALTLVLGSPAAAEEPAPNLNGLWHMNAARSDDVKAKIEEAAGTGMVASASGPRGDWGNIKGGEGDEVERVRLRGIMLQELEEAAKSLEIAQTASEVKLMHGDAGVRIFYFGREGVRTSASGLKLKTSVRWHGQQLVIEQFGEDKTHIAEMYTLLPGGDQMTVSFLWESRFLHAPLKLGLIFDRDKGGS